MKKIGLAVFLVSLVAVFSACGGGGGGGGDNQSTCDERAGQKFTPYAGDTFVPDSLVADWRHSISGLTVVEGPPRHRGIDTIVNPGQEQILIGKFAYGVADKAIIDETVEIWIEASCGVWKKLGSALTSDGTLGTDAGWIFFTIPSAERLGVGSYRVKMLVKGDHTEANFWLHVWPTGTHVIVSDLDGTITTEETSDWSILDPSSPTARPFAADTHQAYAAKGYRVINLSARPGFLTQGTRDWLDAKGFPTEVLHLSQSSGEVGQAALDYKKAYLQSLIMNQGVLIDWAYGNTESDLSAYLGVGIPAGRIYMLDYFGDMKGANLLAGYDSEPARVACLPPVAIP